jgi:hypothetical protein
MTDTAIRKSCRNYDHELQQADEPMNDVSAARVVGVKPATMRSWRCRGIGPTYSKLGPGVRAAVRYRRRDLEDFLDQCRQMPSVRQA